MAEQYSPLADFTESFNKYLVTPLNAFGLGGFVFDIEGETTVNLATEITDHFVEDTTTIQDHIAIKPKRVTLKSYVGELVFRQDDSTNTFVQKAVQKLTTVNQFLPTLTTMAQQALDVRNGDLTLETVKNAVTSKTINRITDYWAFAQNLLSQDSRQQQAYLYFKALMEQKMFVSVQTPFEFMNRMAIESITAIQAEDSKYISDFSITLKEIRTAELLVAAKKQYQPERILPVDTNNYQNRSAQQVSDQTNNGGVPGIPTKEPLRITVYRTPTGAPPTASNNSPLTQGRIPNYDPRDPTWYSTSHGLLDGIGISEKELMD